MINQDVVSISPEIKSIKNGTFGKDLVKDAKGNFRGALIGGVVGLVLGLALKKNVYITSIIGFIAGRLILSK